MVKILVILAGLVFLLELTLIFQASNFMLYSLLSLHLVSLGLGCYLIRNQTINDLFLLDALAIKKEQLTKEFIADNLLTIACLMLILPSLITPYARRAVALSGI